ncbi:MAG: ATP-dependent DNA helicase [Alphaproteobacteria bacterium]
MSDILLPPVPILIIKGSKAFVLSLDGEIETITLRDAALFASSRPFIVCHKKAVATALEVKNHTFFDVLELFAFCRPAEFCVPTISGLAEYLDIPQPQTIEQQAMTLAGITLSLLEKLRGLTPKENFRAASVAEVMKNDGWLWGEAVLTALGNPSHNRLAKYSDVLNRLKEWQEYYREAPDKIEPIDAAQARQRLARVLEKSGSHNEDRPEQTDYTSAASLVFDKNENGRANIVIAEAGTGVGKTLGYLSPSSLFSEKNCTSVWISTFTKNLQKQIDNELSLIYPEKGNKEYNVTIRKGRENYVCLLNFEDACNSLHKNRENAALCGLIARWLEATRYGDLASGDFPSWLADILGRSRTLALTDHHGECLYAACPHYRKCFIEKTLRRAKRSNLVIANHALVMAQGALGGLDDDNCPSYYVFDEGHHLFAAADAAFSAHLTGGETFELKRWIQGAETGTKSRAKGLKRRLENIEVNEETLSLVQEIVEISECLPKTGWLNRILNHNPLNATEELLVTIHSLVRNRNLNDSSEYSIEAEIPPQPDELILSAETLAKKLSFLLTKLKKLAKILLELSLKKLEADDNDDEITKIDALIRSLKQRTIIPIGAFLDMLDVLKGGSASEEFVDWLEITRENAQDIDIGMHRHYVDPTKPFANTFVAKAKGMLITSATLKDRTQDLEKNWQAAELSTGVKYFLDNVNLTKASIASPFNYQEQTKILIINDIPKNNIKALSLAYAKLFIAAEGGALGIFTSIKRLKNAYPNIYKALDDNGLNLLSQHVDGMDTGTLIDIFKEEKNSCLLGTDAVRDGVDVPGQSLRLIAFEKVPWQKNTILQKRRKKEFGAEYTDIQTRMKLAQAFGRLIRKKTDKGVFVMLDSAFPSRLHSAFPENCSIEILGLNDACDIIKSFLSPDNYQPNSIKS